MNIMTQPGKSPVDIQSKPVTSEMRWFWRWLSSWELYVIIIISAFLRLYRIQTSEFDGDQADIFQMAHNAVSHGLLIATSNVASIKIFNPPGIEYLLMIPAAVSSNPLWGAVFTAVLAIAGVLLTYLFARRYYGRLAATFTGGLFAVASYPIFYSRFMWNQNMLLFFVPLFIYFLFRGALDKRRVWFFPAVLLYALLLQFHASSVVLIAPLAVAVLLAPWRTIRWYDLLLILCGLFVLYAPYYLWLSHSNFRDIAILMASSDKKKVFSTAALAFYQSFLGALDKPYMNPSSVMYKYGSEFDWMRNVMTALLIGGALTALGLVVWSRSAVRRQNVLFSAGASVWKWCKDLRASSQRSGLLILLTWQVIPLVYLLYPTVKLQPHYFIMLMPGPFIFIGVFLSKVVTWARRYAGWGRIIGLGICCLAVLLVLFEGMASLGYVIDSSVGNFVDTNWSSNYYNDLNSLQQVIQLADQQADQRHIHRIFIATNQPQTHAFDYLASINRIPTTVEDTACLLMPDPQEGAALLITGPQSAMNVYLATAIAHASDISMSSRLGGPPFHLYVLNAQASSNPAPTTFGDNTRLLSVRPTGANAGRGFISQWQFLQTQPASYRTTYHYQFADAQQAQGAPISTRTCNFSDVHAGDQVLVPLQKMSPQQTQLDMRVITSTTVSVTLTYKLAGVISVPFSTFNLKDTPWKALPITQGRARISVSQK